MDPYDFLIIQFSSLDVHSRNTNMSVFFGGKKVFGFDNPEEGEVHYVSGKEKKCWMELVEKLYWQGYVLNNFEGTCYSHVCGNSIMGQTYEVLCLDIISRVADTNQRITLYSNEDEKILINYDRRIDRVGLFHEGDLVLEGGNFGVLYTPGKWEKILEGVWKDILRGEDVSRS